MNEQHSTGEDKASTATTSQVVAVDKDTTTTASLQNTTYFDLTGSDEDDGNDDTVVQTMSSMDGKTNNHSATKGGNSKSIPEKERNSTTKPSSAGVSNFDKQLTTDGATGSNGNATSITTQPMMDWYEKEKESLLQKSLERKTVEKQEEEKDNKNTTNGRGFSASMDEYSDTSNSVNDKYQQDNEKEEELLGIKPMDVLFGRAGHNRKGNQLYWEQVLKQVLSYPKVMNDKQAQLDLARQVLDYVENVNGGRFMVLDSNENWVVGPKDMVLSKIKRAIKEKYERSNSDSQEITPNDVLLQFGNHNHSGNKQYWDYVLKEAVPGFEEIADDKKAQFDLARKVIEHVEKVCGGRFLRPNTKGGWEVAPEDTVLFKVRRAIKERWERTQRISRSGNKKPKAIPTHDTVVDDTDIHPMDVLFGPLPNKSHEGNLLYSEYVNSQAHLFGKVAGDKKAELKLAQEVIDQVEKKNGGRFMEVDDYGKWLVTPTSRALSKIRNAIKVKWERGRSSGAADEMVETAEAPEEEQGDINPKDVLFGRPRSREGNQVYWEYLMNLLPGFVHILDDKDAQFDMARNVVNFVENEYGGRFMEQNEDGVWVEADKTTALQKVRRAIKEKWERDLRKKQPLLSGKKQSTVANKKKKEKGVAYQAKADTTASRPKRSKVITTKEATSFADYTIQLTHDIVDALKDERKAIGQRTLANRVEAQLDDVERICTTLAELGMVHVFKEEVQAKNRTQLIKRVVWWEYAGSFLKRKSWEVMPLSDDTEQCMRSEMSMLVREEAKLDVWISRLRNLRGNPHNPDQLYLSTADIRKALNSEATNQNQAAEPAQKKIKKARKEPTVAIHAPFGSVIQSSTPISYRQEKAVRTRQLLVSCKESGQSDEGSSRQDRVQVYFLPKSDQKKIYALHENPVMQWIKQPSYTSEIKSGAGDPLHVSCLQDDEGLSSFFQ